MKTKKTVIISEELYYALIELVDECNTYEGMAQTDENFEYGPETALGRVNKELIK